MRGHRDGREKAQSVEAGGGVGLVGATVREETVGLADEDPRRPNGGCP